MRDILNATSAKGILGTIGSLTLAQWSHVASIIVAAITAAYMVYRWIRDAREDSSGAPGFISELSAARERIAALETSAAQAIAALKQTSP